MRLPSWLTRPITRLEYLVACITLFVIQYPMHEAIAHAHGRHWGLRSYVWPVPSDPLPVGHEPHEMWLILFWASTPFMMIGATLTARRFADAGVPKLWALAGLVPLLDRVVMLVALARPTRRGNAAALVQGPYRDADLGPVPQSRPTLVMKLLPRTTWAAFAISCLLTSVMTYGTVVTLYEDTSGGAALMFFALPVIDTSLVAFALTYGKDTTNKELARWLLLAAVLWLAAVMASGIPGIAGLLAFLSPVLLLPGALFGAWMGAAIGRNVDTHVGYEVPASTEPNQASSGSGSPPDCL